MNLDYCSDSRGYKPFYPVLNGVKYNTLQIPSTLPTADEILGVNGITTENIDQFYFNSLKIGLNVITIHAELEGMAIRDSFRKLLALVKKDSSIKVLTFGEIASEFKNSSSCELYMGEIAGRAGKVAIQK